MDIYQKDKILQQIREQINLNKKNIDLKGGYLEKSSDNQNIKDIMNLFKNEKNDMLNVKNIQILKIEELINDLENSILSHETSERIKKRAKHEKNILENLLKNIRSN